MGEFIPVSETETERQRQTFKQTERHTVKRIKTCRQTYRKA